MRDLAVRSRGKRTPASSPTASEAAAVDLDAVYDDFIGCLKLYLAQQEYEDLGSGLLLRRQDLADAAFETALEHGIGELEDAGCLNKAGDHYRVSKRALQQATSRCGLLCVCLVAALGAGRRSSSATRPRTRFEPRLLWLLGRSTRSTYSRPGISRRWS